uniref:protein-serine/threonine phosphatase n=1 Tax=Setaria italica TaxID=4555 RepID=K3ZP34_SETIT
HRGAIAAEYVKEHLLRNLIEHPKSITDTKAAIGSKPGPGAGSTAVTAIFVGGRLLVANVGDSRAVICKGGQGITNSDERHIIEDAGGYVMWDEGWRVGGVVPVSRAFGDKLLKQYVVADPEIKEVVVDSSLEFIILASNGLWQVVTNEGAVAIAKRHIWDPEESAKELPNEAYKRETSDNTTVVIVRFLHENSELPSI